MALVQRAKGLSASQQSRLKSVGRSSNSDKSESTSYSSNKSKYVTTASGLTEEQALRLKAKTSPAARDRLRQYEDRQVAARLPSLPPSERRAIEQGLAGYAIEGNERGERYTAATPAAAEALRIDAERAYQERVRRAEKEYEQAKKDARVAFTPQERAQRIKEAQQELRRDISTATANKRAINRVLKPINPAEYLNARLKDTNKKTHTKKKEMDFFDRSITLLRAHREMLLARDDVPFYFKKDINNFYDYEGKGGTIEPAPSKEEREYAAKVAREERRKANRQKVSDTITRNFWNIGISGAIGFLSLGKAAKGGYKVIRHPITTGKQISRFVKEVDIKKVPGVVASVGKSELYDFSSDPLGYMAELEAFTRGLRFVGKGIKANKLANTIDREIFITGLPEELRKPVRKIIKAIESQKKIKSYKDIRLRDIKDLRVETLTKGETEAALKAVNKTYSVLFGSGASRVLTGGKTKIPHDLDIATRSINGFFEEFKAALPKAERSNYVLRGEKITTKSGRSLFDIKPLSRLYPSNFLGKRSLPVTKLKKKLVLFQKRKSKGDIISKTLNYDVVFKPELKDYVVASRFEIFVDKPIRFEGIKFISIGQQTVRKGLGTLQNLIEKNVRRAKDPAGLLELLLIQKENLKITKPLTIIGRAQKKTKMKNINEAIKLLRSNRFKKLLTGDRAILEDYKAVGKIPVSKLPVRNFKQIQKKAIEKVRQAKSYLPKARTSRIVASRLPRTKSSKLSSKLPRSRKSKIPASGSSRTPASKLTNKAFSKLPGSLLPRGYISLLPSRLPSRIPSKLPSKLPSRLPSKLPSKNPSKLPGKNPSEEKKKRRIKIKLPDIKKEVRKVISDSKRKREFIYLPDLAALINGERVKGGQAKALLRKGRIFTGLEARPII